MYKPINVKYLVVLFSFIVSSYVYAQDADVVSELITDRPDATESPNTVPKGNVQIETGAFYESFEENDFKTEVYGYNTTLVRYGLLSNLELRLGWDFEETQFSVGGEKFDPVLSGFSPLLAGVKVEVAEANGWMPEIGLLGHLYLPISAATDYRPETTGVDFRFSFAHTLSEKSSFAYNLGAQWMDDSPEAAYVYTFVYGLSVSETIGVYAELYGDLPEDNRANHFWDAGFTFLLQQNIQLDATIGQSITKGQDILVSAGVSFRLPK